MIGVRGASLTFEGNYVDSLGAPADAASPGVTIVNPADQTVVTAVPTHVATGRYSYTYAIPADARLGLYLVQWSGTVGGSPTFGAESFEVLAAGVAPWIEPDALADEPRLTNLKLPPTLTMEALCQAATDLLWRWSGRKYNAQARTARPVRLSSLCSCGWDVAGWWGSGALVAGMWGCGCDAGPVLDLPAPATVTAVKVDGAALPSSSYTLYDGHLLARTDGRVWPCCQSLSQPDTAPGTWSVAYVHGTPPTTAGTLACRELAVQIAMQLSGKDSKLPNRTRSVQRQGISIDISDAGYLRDGLTGIFVIDAFLVAENPQRRTRRASVVSPDSIVGLST